MFTLEFCRHRADLHAEITWVTHLSVRKPCCLGVWKENANDEAPGCWVDCSLLGDICLVMESNLDFVCGDIERRLCLSLS